MPSRLNITHKDLIAAICTAAMLIGWAFAVDGRYAKSSIEQRVANIEKVVCLSAIKNKVSGALETCEAVLK